ncbi:hypothetical protein AB0P21_22725 [Kribbella sp. NPDC056861]|uniref:hypothetical protein n=1 Tax=Kribbella sp. NPDC056861 TaxID=3154857 RepID=UPI003434B65B
MAPAGEGLAGLPEPGELHVRMSVLRMLDWGDPIPSKKAIAEEFGVVATTRSLALLAEVAAVERAVTEELVAAVRPGIVAYQLESRVKSPQSLARKLSTVNAYRAKQTTPEDLLRYTVVAPEPDDLVEAAGDTVEALRSGGWDAEAAHHSYVDGSRYKGLHAFLRAHGMLVELQVHSRESIDIKTQTTLLYEIERDPRQDKETRAGARAQCVALSDGMRQPVGIERLSELGGVPMAVRSYGRSSRAPAPRPETGTQRPAEAGPAASQRVTNLEHRKGRSR